MNEAHARQIAGDFLTQRCEEFRSGQWVLTVAEDYDTAWAVGYQALAFVESGNVLDSLVGNGPVVVPKSGKQHLDGVVWAAGRRADRTRSAESRAATLAGLTPIIRSCRCRREPGHKA